MTVLEFKVKCPMCEGTIVIDARNGKLIRHWEANQREEDEAPDPAEFDQALDNVDRMEKESDSIFSDAMKKVSDKKKGLEDLFKDASEKAKKKKDRPEDRKDFWD